MLVEAAEEEPISVFVTTRDIPRFEAKICGVLPPP